jgi:hypothetical protein
MIHQQYHHIDNIGLEHRSLKETFCDTRMLIDRISITHDIPMPLLTPLISTSEDGTRHNMEAVACICQSLKESLTRRFQERIGALMCPEGEMPEMEDVYIRPSQATANTEWMSLERRKQVGDELWRRIQEAHTSMMQVSVEAKVGYGSVSLMKRGKPQLGETSMMKIVDSFSCKTIEEFLGE